MKIINKYGTEYERKDKVLNYNKKFLVKISEEQLNEGNKKAKELGITFSELIRRGLNIMIERGK